MSIPARIPALVLASTSTYRRALLDRLRVPYVTDTPGVDEEPLAGESPRATALRLAEAKARAVAPRHPAALIIGSDQVAVLEGQPLGKPGTHDRAVAQLLAMRGKAVTFHTALCLLDTRDGRCRVENVPTTVYFRQFSEQQADRYCRADTPYDCAGSAKIETLGIALVERVASDDPTALIGLPLIALTSLLREAGVEIV